jgi:hypothetical protein
MAREQEVLEVERPMVHNNHPVSTDWLVMVVSKTGERRLVRRLQKGFPEDPLELFALNISWMIREVKKERFFKKVGLSGHIAVSALECIFKDGEKS